MFKYIVSVLVGVMLSNAQASYIVASFNSDELDTNKPTRVLLVGQGDELKLLFQEVATAKAIKYKEQYPEDQILLIAVNEKDVGSEWALKKWGFTLHNIDRRTLDGKEFLKITVPFKKIRSLDIFSHSSAQFGVHLEGHGNRLNLNTKNIENLRPNFMKDAYAYLHGCNTGFNLAPYLSNVWGIPVAGSMTSTNFQRLHSDGHFYLSEEGFAPNSAWATENSLSFNETMNCKKGTCQRLKPDNTPYVGWWGAYREGGLPFYKFFCVRNSAEDCKRVMAKSMLSHSLIVDLKKNSSLEEYKKGIVDFLCPISSKKDLRGECQAKLDEALVTQDKTYNPFSRPQVECDFKGCKAEITCDKIFFKGVDKPGTCELKNLATSPATTLVREYKAYLDAYKYLAK
jgi:hypothetical protein